MIDNATDIAAEHLEDLLNDECNCEATHVRTKCSYKVTHRQLSCAFDVLTCLNYALYKMHDDEYLDRHGRRCGYCRRDLGECWNIIPV